MNLKFAKMQALGNDFVVLDAVNQSIPLDAALCQRLADRRLGIGCDQILVVEPAPAGQQADFGYRIFNADGSEVGQCGNGARCLARFIERRGLSTAQEFTLATRTTTMRAVLLSDGWVRVHLPSPDFEPAIIPLKKAAVSESYSFSTPQGEISGGAVSVGNPHLVIEVADVDQAPVESWGTLMTRHPDFPEGVNVGFVERVNDGELRLRVFERGVGETPACGSGACAAAVVMRHWRKTAEQVIIDLPGGRLRVAWDEGGEVLLEGPADWVFEGEITI